MNKKGTNNSFIYNLFYNFVGVSLLKQANDIWYLCKNNFDRISFC
jgi:hypothetical protein